MRLLHPLPTSLPLSLCLFLLHTPDLPLPLSIIVAVLARGLSVGVTDELMKMQQVPKVEWKGWRTESDRDTGSESEKETERKCDGGGGLRCTE